MYTTVCAHTEGTFGFYSWLISEAITKRMRRSWHLLKKYGQNSKVASNNVSVCC